MLTKYWYNKSLKLASSVSKCKLPALDLFIRYISLHSMDCYNKIIIAHPNWHQGQFYITFKPQERMSRGFLHGEISLREAGMHQTVLDPLQEKKKKKSKLTLQVDWYVEFAIVFKRFCSSLDDSRYYYLQKGIWTWTAQCIICTSIF